MKDLTTEIEINSSPQAVWDILTDFSNYPQWNPILTKVVGQLSIGNKLEIHITTVGGKSRIYHPKITKIVPNQDLRWTGKFFLPQIFSGERIFLIEKVSIDKINFVNKEIFSGIGIKLAPQKMENDILLSFKKMNEALKKTAEHS
ncbi:MAG TPA: SRPBCC domain-containing protein [Nitrososphaeraceae archaeon]|nr:SRPBCC domain-containing protein [Nitrososphaeraceae archaeon]